QVAMAVRANRPVVDRGARGDGLDMDEVEGLIVRRIAIEVEQRECGGCHAKIISQREQRENVSRRRASASGTSIQNIVAPPTGGACARKRNEGRRRRGQRFMPPCWPPRPGSCDC